MVVNHSTFQTTANRWNISTRAEGAYGFYMRLTADWVLANNSAVVFSGNTFQCTAERNSAYGFFVDRPASVTNQSSLVVSGNRFFITSTYSLGAIRLQRPSTVEQGSSIEMEGNRLNLTSTGIQAGNKYSAIHGFYWQLPSIVDASTLRVRRNVCHMQGIGLHIYMVVVDQTLSVARNSSFRLENNQCVINGFDRLGAFMLGGFQASDSSTAVVDGNTVQILGSSTLHGIEWGNEVALTDNCSLSVSGNRIDLRGNDTTVGIGFDKPAAVTLNSSIKMSMNVVSVIAGRRNGNGATAAYGIRFLEGVNIESTSALFFEELDISLVGEGSANFGIAIFSGTRLVAGSSIVYDSVNINIHCVSPDAGANGQVGLELETFRLYESTCTILRVQVTITGNGTKSAAIRFGGPTPRLRDGSNVTIRGLKLSLVGIHTLHGITIPFSPSQIHNGSTLTIANVDLTIIATGSTTAGQSIAYGISLLILDIVDHSQLLLQAVSIDIHSPKRYAQGLEFGGNVRDNSSVAVDRCKINVVCQTNSAISFGVYSHLTLQNQSSWSVTNSQFDAKAFDRTLGIDFGATTLEGGCAICVVNNSIQVIAPSPTTSSETSMLSSTIYAIRQEGLNLYNESSMTIEGNTITSTGEDGATCVRNVQQLELINGSSLLLRNNTIVFTDRPASGVVVVSGPTTLNENVPVATSWPIFAIVVSRNIVRLVDRLPYTGARSYIVSLKSLAVGAKGSLLLARNDMMNAPSVLLQFNLLTVISGLRIDPLQQTGDVTWRIATQCNRLNGTDAATLLGAANDSSIVNPVALSNSRTILPCGSCGDFGALSTCDPVAAQPSSWTTTATPTADGNCPCDCRPGAVGSTCSTCKPVGLLPPLPGKEATPTQQRSVSASLQRTSTNLAALRRTAAASHSMTGTLDNTATEPAPAMGPSGSQTSGRTQTAPPRVGQGISTSSTLPDNAPTRFSTSKSQENDDASNGTLRSRSVTLNFRNPTVDERVPANAGATAAAINSVISAKAAVAVAGTGTASAAVSTLANPAAAGSAVRVGMVASVIDCAFNSDSVTPSVFEHPVQASMGDSVLKEYVGSMLITTILFIVVPSLALLGCFLFGRSKEFVPSWLGTLQYRVISTLAAIGFSYFAAVVFKSAVLVAGHSGDGMSSVVGLACAVLAAIPVGILTYLIVKPFTANIRVTSADGKPELESCDGNVMFLETLRAFVDGAREPHRWVLRVYFVEEVFVTITLGILDGLRPSSGACAAVAGSMLFVCTIHMAYLLFFRPYRAKLELFFVSLTALLLLLLSLMALVITIVGNTPTLEKVIGYVALAENVVFFLQAVALAIWAYTVAERRKVRRMMSSDGEVGDRKPTPQVADSGSDSEMLSTHLLLNVPTPPEDRSNPLAV